MEKYFEVLRKCPLFNDITDDCLISLLSCLGAKVVSCIKNETIIYEGETAINIGIVLSGSIQLEHTDYYGNRSIVTSLQPSELFGEAYACAGAMHFPFNVIATDNSEILLIDCNKIIHSCSNACEFHSQMILNLLKIVATKNIFLNQKAEIISKRTTREKLLTYLMSQAKKNGSNSFTVPYDRQELADFLQVDRSGLSAEISKLRNEGIIESYKSNFRLLN